MSEFRPSIINLNDINGGQRYNNGDGVGAEAINSAIEASAFAQALGTNQPNIENVDNIGTPSVSIETMADGTPRLKFENLGGEKDIDTIKNTNKITAIENALIKTGTIDKAEGFLDKEFQQTGGDELVGLTVLDESYATVNKIQGDTVAHNSELKNAKISGIKSTGRNLIRFPYANTDMTKNGLTFTVQNDGGIKISGTATKYTDFYLYRDKLNLPIGVNFTISGGDNVISVPVRRYRANGTETAWLSNSKPTGSLSSGETLRSIGLYVAPNEPLDTVVYPMFNFGDTALPYEPYTENIMSLPQTIELGKWDYIENGKIVRQTSEEYTITGNNSWDTVPQWDEQDNAYTIYVLGLEALVGDTVLDCISTSELNAQIRGGVLEFSEKDNLPFTTLDGCKAYFNANPFKIKCKKATPTYENITFDNQYLVWDKGAEIVLGDDNDDYDANPTITNDYMILLGGK